LLRPRTRLVFGPARDSAERNPKKPAMTSIRLAIRCLLTACTLQLLFSTPGLAQQGPFKDNYAWRNEYRVGQAVEVNPGVNPGLKNIDWIQCW
jgi:hypothetical protein